MLDYKKEQKGRTEQQTLQLPQRLRIDDRLSLDLGLGNALPSPESVALRVAGMKRQATLSLNYMPTRVDQIQIEHRRENYRLQNGEALGNGRHTGISYSHALRQETPDLQVGAFWSIHRFDRQALSDSGQLARFHRDYLPAEQKLLYPKVTNLPDNYFVPDHFHFYGLRLSTNTRFEQDYTRAWRPFGSISLTRHSEHAGFGIADGNGRLAAFLHHAVHAPTGEIGASVLPNHRHQGLARQLFAAAFAHARKRGVQTIHLATGHPAALRLCVALGRPFTLRPTSPRALVDLNACPLRASAIHQRREDTALSG